MSVAERQKQRRMDYDFEEMNISDYALSFGMSWKHIIYFPFYRYTVYFYTLVVVASVSIALHVLVFQPTGSYYHDYLFHVITCLDLLYLVRTVCAILHRLFHNYRNRKIFQPEPIPLLFIDVCTLVPVAPYCYLINRYNWRNPIDHRIGNYYSAVLQLPRVIRLYFWYKIIYRDLSMHPRTVVLLTHMTLSFLFTLISSAAFYLVYLYNPNEQSWADHFVEMNQMNESHEAAILSFVHAGCHFYQNVANPIPQYSVSEMYTVVGIFLASFMVHFYLVAHLLAVYVQLMRFSHFFEWRLIKMSLYTKLMGFDQSLQDAIITYYRTIWTTRGGFVDLPDIVKLFPLQLKIEISMDLYFDAMRHATIFKIFQETVKKQVCLLFETKVYIPGQLLFQRGMVKSKLVYLHSGILEVMSTENCDSPVLSLSPGTILGEVSCLEPYVSSVDIRCSTVCVVHVLRCSALNVIRRRDPLLDAKLRQIISERVAYARKKLQVHRRLENPISHISWIKTRWRKLIVNVTRKTRKALPYEPLTKYFCSRYLNLLVVSSYYELKVHSICVRDQCSFVMESDSSFRRFLDTFTMLCVLIHFCITFHMIIFVGEIKAEVYAALPLLDLVYLMDIYVQAITAVHVQNVFISKPMDILVYKCKQFQFLLDLFASLPYDYIAALVNASPYYVGLCRLPKYIKLYKVVQFFACYARSMVLYRRLMNMLKIIVIHVFFVISCACFIYILTCFKNECRPDGWLVTYKTWEWHTNHPLQASDFLISLIYAASIAVQLDIHHVMPQNISELCLQFSITVCGFYLLYLTTVEISGVIALENCPRFLYMFHLSYYENILVDRPELRPLRQNIQEYISLQWVYSMSIQLDDVITLMDHKSKFIQYKVTHEFIINHLRKTILFRHVSDEFLLLLTKSISVHVIPMNHILQSFDTSSTNLYVIIDGYCKVYSHAPDDAEKKAVFYYTKPDVFPLVGYMQKVNSFIHVQTDTAVKVLTIPYHHFETCLKAIPQEGRIFTRTIEVHLEQHRNLIQRIYHWPLLHYPKPRERETVDMFAYKRRKNQLVWGKPAAANKLRRALIAIFIQTHNPHTTFIYYEITRSLFIILEMVCLFLSMLRFVRQSPIYNYVMIVVQCINILDVWVRSHVQYYTDIGVRVTKFSATFMHYMNHAFLIDLISALPYERMQIFEIFRSLAKNRVNVIISLLVQPLKLYRLVCLQAYIRKTICIRHYNVLMVSFNSFLLVFFIFELAAIGLVISCTISDDWEWICPTDSWLYNVEAYTYWRDNDLIYARAVLEVIIVHVMRSAKYFSTHDYIHFLTMSLLMCILYIWYESSIVGHTVFSTTYLQNFQERRRRYNNLAARVNFPKALRRELLEHYKYLFQKTQTDGSNVRLLYDFYPHLREAIQLAAIIPTMRAAPIFDSVPSEFFRFICPFLKEDFYIINAIILHCNDINRRIFFVKKGFVEIFIADQSVAMLTVGGMFGCFTHRGVSRCTIQAVAAAHTELLTIDTKKFMKVTQPYGQVCMKMKAAHITSTEFFESHEVANVVHRSSTRNKFHRSTLRNWFRYTFDDQSRFIIFYQYFTNMHMVPITSIVAVVNLIMITIFDEWTIFWGLIDLYFLINMYMTCHIVRPCIETGVRVTEVKRLTRTYLKSWKFYIDVFTLIPLYPFKPYVHTKHSSILLLNKSFRITNLIAYYTGNVRTRYLPYHVRFTILIYILIFFLNIICYIMCVIRMVLDDEILDSTQTLYTYLYMMNAFIKTGVLPPPLTTFTVFLYMSLSIFLAQVLFVLINAGFCKLAVMRLYWDMEFRRAVITFQEYCRNEYVSKSIIDQCSYYLMHFHSKHGVEQFPTLILEAPHYLLDAHMAYLTADLINRNPLFKFAHGDFLRMMMRFLRYEFIMPGYNIVEAGDLRRTMYFIAEGRVISINTTPGFGNLTYFEILDKGDSFGEMQAIRGIRYLQTYKALTPVQLFGLTNTDWSGLIKWFPATEQTMLRKRKSVGRNTTAPKRASY